jgi:hypothetical protein
MPASVIGARFGCERFLHPVGPCSPHSNLGMRSPSRSSDSQSTSTGRWAQVCSSRSTRRASRTNCARQGPRSWHNATCPGSTMASRSIAARLDLVVAGQLIVEVKSVQALAPIHTAQILTCLKLTGWPIGLLIKLNVPLLENGIKRVINPHPARGDTSARRAERGSGAILAQDRETERGKRTVLRYLRSSAVKSSC